jgi:hypothetical protein
MLHRNQYHVGFKMPYLVRNETRLAMTWNWSLCAGFFLLEMMPGLFFYHRGEDCFKYMTHLFFLRKGLLFLQFILMKQYVFNI